MSSLKTRKYLRNSWTNWPVTESCTPNGSKSRSIAIPQTPTTTTYDTVEEEETEEEVTPEEVTEEEATRDPAPAETTATSIKMILYMTRA